MLINELVLIILIKSFYLISSYIFVHFSIGTKLLIGMPVIKMLAVY